MRWCKLWLWIFLEVPRSALNNYCCKPLKTKSSRNPRIWSRILGNGWPTITTSRSLRSMSRDTGLRNRKETSWSIKKLRSSIRKEIFLLQDTDWMCLPFKLTSIKTILFILKSSMICLVRIFLILTLSRRIWLELSRSVDSMLKRSSKNCSKRRTS